MGCTNSSTLASSPAASATLVETRFQELLDTGRELKAQGMYVEASVVLKEAESIQELSGESQSVADMTILFQELAAISRLLGHHRESAKYRQKLHMLRDIYISKDDYTILSLIGSGRFGSVFEATRKNGRKVALKFFGRGPVIPTPEGVVGEIYHLYELKVVQNVVHVEAVCKTDAAGAEDELDWCTFPVIVMECLEGGNLFEYLLRIGKSITEDMIAGIFKRIVNIVHDIQEHGYIHRNINPENILSTSLSDDAELKFVGFHLMLRGPEILDLGHHVLIKPPEAMSSNKYSFKTDIYQLGYCLFMMLSGSEPPEIDPDGDIHIIFESEEWEGISSAAKDLVLHCLLRSEFDRISCKAILHHPWFTTTPEEGVDQGKVLGAEYIDRICVLSEARKDIWRNYSAVVDSREIDVSVTIDDSEDEDGGGDNRSARPMIQTEEKVDNPEVPDESISLSAKPLHESKEDVRMVEESSPSAEVGNKVNESKQGYDRNLEPSAEKLEFDNSHKLEDDTKIAVDESPKKVGSGLAARMAAMGGANAIRLPGMGMPPRPIGKKNDDKANDLADEKDSNQTGYPCDDTEYGKILHPTLSRAKKVQKGMHKRDVKSNPSVLQAMDDLVRPI